jgi:hypothetical protein
VLGLPTTASCNGISSITDVRVIPPWLGQTELIIGVYVGFSLIFLLGILIFKGLTV